ncbi:MAG: HD domain-containing protein [Nitrosopumilaceae archaeon]|nr:HD domain-containing protein [Nitrosopumilaceae archaeon]NIU85863.1 HD domain-containing protein [Nitrosopumilaceae archaeon]NIX61247.1 HD domain-containing protein [Nitrosopumilaceae archaeon]
MKPKQTKMGIKSSPIGKSFIGFCVVRKKEIKYKQNGKPYLVLELGDHSGRLKARLWEKPLQYAESTHVGTIVKIKAVPQVYQDRRDLKIEKLREVTNNDPIELTDLLPQSTKDIDGLKEQFYKHYNSIHNFHLNQLLSLLFKDKEFTRNYFLAPAGKLWHHNYLSGLLEHVVAMLELADPIKNHYPDLDIDLLKTGIICHNMGKVHEYTLNGFIDISDEGRLLGYVTMGYEIISKKIEEITDFPPELRKRLLHLILSHQGDTPKGAPVVPMTVEAIVLEHLIQLDARTNALFRIKENDAVPDSNWTKYIQLLDRFIYVGQKPNQGKRQHD